jgi:hypothetical protein
MPHARSHGGREDAHPQDDKRDGGAAQAGVLLVRAGCRWAWLLLLLPFSSVCLCASHLTSLLLECVSSFSSVCLCASRLTSCRPIRAQRCAAGGRRVAHHCAQEQLHRHPQEPADRCVSVCSAAVLLLCYCCALCSLVVLLCCCVTAYALVLSSRVLLSGLCCALHARVCVSITCDLFLRVERKGINYMGSANELRT